MRLVAVLRVVLLSPLMDGASCHSPQAGAVAQDRHASQDAPALGGAVRGCGAGQSRAGSLARQRLVASDAASGEPSNWQGRAYARPHDCLQRPWGCECIRVATDTPAVAARQERRAPAGHGMAAPCLPVTTTCGWMRVPPQCCRSKLTVSSSRAARPTAHMKGYLCADVGGQALGRPGEWFEGGEAGRHAAACCSATTSKLGARFSLLVLLGTDSFKVCRRERRGLPSRVQAPRSSAARRTAAAAAGPHLPGGAGLPLLISSLRSACRRRL